MSTCRYSFFTNRFLEQVGLLRHRDPDRKLVPRDQWAHRRLQRFLGGRLGNAVISLARHVLSRTGLKKTWMEEVEWKRTKAYANTWQCRHGIFVNLEGREPEGSVRNGADYEQVRAQVVDALRALRNPYTDEPVVQSVWLREEVFSGPYVRDAPDVIFEPVSGNYLQENRLNAVSCIEPSPEGYSAFHRSPGIWAAAGPGIVHRSEPVQAHITDLAPTILHSMGLPVPEHMDGTVLTSILKMARTVKTYEIDDPYLTGAESQFYTPDEEREMRERLRRLGYF